MLPNNAYHSIPRSAHRIGRRRKIHVFSRELTRDSFFAGFRRVFFLLLFYGNFAEVEFNKLEYPGEGAGVRNGSW